MILGTVMIHVPTVAHLAVTAAAALDIGTIGVDPHPGITEATAVSPVQAGHPADPTHDPGVIQGRGLILGETNRVAPMADKP